jgi:hypothetical protein
METIITSVCCLSLSILACYGTEFDLGKHGTLSFVVPEEWTAKVEPAKKSNTYALSFKLTDDTSFPLTWYSHLRADSAGNFRLNFERSVDSFR